MDWGMVSMNSELAKQWEPVDKTEMRILQDEFGKPMFIQTPDNPEAEVVVGLTFDSSNKAVEIYRSDVFQMCSKASTNLNPVDKMLLMVARYSNQTYPQNPPYCIVLRSPQSHDIWYGRFEEVSRSLDGMQATEEDFFAINFIFIPILLGPPLFRIVLLVVSPLHKTVELLDSDCSGCGIGSVEDKLLAGIFKLLVVHLPRRFDPYDWWVRRDAALQQTFDESQISLAVISNAMSIAFGYEIYGWMSVFLEDSFPPDESIDWDNMKLELRLRDYHLRGLRAASELLHGCFEPYTSLEGDETNPFAYRFGSHDYIKPLTTYRINREGIMATLNTVTIEFRPLFVYPYIYNFALGNPVEELNYFPQVLPIVGDNAEDSRQRRLNLARQALMTELGVEVVISQEGEPSGSGDSW